MASRPHAMSAPVDLVDVQKKSTRLWGLPQLPEIR